MATKKNTRPTAASVDDIRAALGAKKTEREGIAEAPPSRAELGECLDRAIDAAGERAERIMSSRVQSSDYHTESLLTARVEGDRVNLLPTMIAVLGVDAVRQGLSRFVERAEDGPSPAERAERLAAIDAELLDLEMAEERAVRVLETEGVEIIRRGDANPAVVLADL